MMVPDCPGKMVCVLVSRSSGPGSNPSSLAACFSKVPKTKSQTLWLESCFMHIFLIYMNRGPFHTRSFRRIHVPVLILTKNGSAWPKGFRTLRCVLGQDQAWGKTLFSQCLSPPRCVNRYRVGVPLQWTSILSMGRRVGRVEIPLVTSFYWIRDKLQPDWPLDSYVDFETSSEIFGTVYTSSVLRSLPCKFEGTSDSREFRYRINFDRF